MTARSLQLLLWAPRLLSLALCAFLGLFALDALGGGRPLRQALTGFAIHLIPSAIVLALALLAWRRPRIGGAGFVALALFYATAMARGRVDWMLVIAGPVLITGVLFLCSGCVRQQTVRV